jgi:GcrA cell cycle regulator
LLADECRWPFGDPLSGDFHFCGARKQDGRPYCEVHTREAFQTAKPRAVVQRPVIA